MRTTRFVAVGAAAVLTTGMLAVGTWAGANPSRDHRVDPGRFRHPVSNPYFPLRPGLVTRLQGRDGPERFREKVTITSRKKTIEGVRTTVVHDVLHRRSGTLAEKTDDWYAADNHGNVWYFGENTATYDEHGQLESREGSWQAGVHGAQPGLIMPAHPHATLAYRQEFWRGHAEDQAWIVQAHATATVPYGTFHSAVRSFEWSRLEAGVVSVKFYARGIGIVRERDVAGGSEVFGLTGVSRP